METCIALDNVLNGLFLLSISALALAIIMRMHAPELFRELTQRLLAISPSPGPRGHLHEDQAAGEYRCTGVGPDPSPVIDIRAVLESLSPYPRSPLSPPSLDFSSISSQRLEDGAFEEIRKLIRLTKEEIRVMQRKIDQTDERLKVVEEIQAWLDASHMEPMEYTMDNE